MRLISAASSTSARPLADPAAEGSVLPDKVPDRATRTRVHSVLATNPKRRATRHRPPTPSAAQGPNALHALRLCDDAYAHARHGRLYP